MPSLLTTDLIGHVFGRLRVIRFLGTKREASRTFSYWLCKCICGRKLEVRRGSLTSGNTISCGCYKEENNSNFRHGHCKGGPSTEYKSWQDMLARCYNKHNKNYSDYGGRGITVCKRWLKSFDKFLADLGSKPKGYTLERKRVNGNYTPNNCCWASRKTQSNNRRNTKFIIAFGIRVSIKRAAELAGINFTTLKSRLQKGLDPEDALTKPVRSWVDR